MDPASISHPVPQNVTDFQFHLVGDMTLKQFGYLAGGLGVAYLIFIIFANIFPLIAYPLIVLFAGSGAALAFLPIQERPLDLWLGSFIKAIFSPTQLKYKYGYFQKDDPRFKDRLKIYLQRYENPVLPKPILPVANTLAMQPGFLNSVVSKPIFQSLKDSPSGVSSKPVQTNANPPSQIQSNQTPGKVPEMIISQQITPNFNISPEVLPSSEEINRTVELAKKAQNIQIQITESEHELNEIKAEAAIPGANPADFAQKFQEVINKLQQLNSEASQVSKQLIPQPQKNSVTQTPKVAPAPQQPKIAPTLTLTSTPNIVNGIVTDALGNYVDQAIIVTHDRQGLPVRALKTNKLGQFVAATPLPNGTYTIMVEKDDLVFDTIQIDLAGELLKPILVQARKADRPTV